MQFSVLQSTLRTMLGVDTVRLDPTACKLYLNQACERLSEEFQAPWDEVFFCTMLTADTPWAQMVQRQYDVDPNLTVPISYPGKTSRLRSSNLIKRDVLSAPSDEATFYSPSSCHVRVTFTIEDTKEVDVLGCYDSVGLLGVGFRVKTDRTLILHTGGGFPIATGSTLTNDTKYTFDLVLEASGSSAVKAACYVDGQLDVSGFFYGSTPCQGGIVRHDLATNDILLESCAWSTLSPKLCAIRDITGMIYIDDDGYQQEIEQRTWEELFEKYQLGIDCGDPRQWAWHNGQVWFGPPPDSDLEISMWTRCKSLEMVADTDENGWAREFPRLVWLKAALESNIHLLEDERLALFSQWHEQDIERVESRLARRDIPPGGRQAVEPG